MTEITRIIDLAKEINQEHELAEKALRDGLAHALRAGELLLEAKEITAHGTWGDWLEENFSFSKRTAQNYMRLSRRRDELEKAQHVADLSYRDAIAYLAEPKKKELEVHELGMLFPMVEREALERWAQEIKSGLGSWEEKNAFGLFTPIALFEGKILDGKCRFEAFKIAGIEPKYKNFPDDYPPYKGSARDFVISANGARSHWSEDQKATIALKLEEYLQDVTK